MKNLSFIVLLSLLFTIISCNQAPSNLTSAKLTLQANSPTFNNPLVGSGADPFMTYYNGNYYLLYTTNGSTIQIRKSASVASLSTTPETQVWNDTDPSRDSFHWAPEIHYLNGPNGNRWYIYYTAGPSNCCGNQRLYVLESSGTDPLGPYTFKGQLLSTYSIDATIFVSGSNMYAIYARVDNGNSVEIIKLSNPWTVTGSPTRIAEATAPWERQFGVVNEAPAAIVRGGKIFLTYSANDCSSPNYSLGLLTANESSNLLLANSWVKSPGAVFQRNDAGGVYGPGHNGFFKSPDGTEDWIIYHAVTNPNGSCGGDRSTRVQKITWNGDGTPNFGVPINLATPITLPSGDPGSPGSPSLEPTKVTFEASSIGNYYLRHRNALVDLTLISSSLDTQDSQFAIVTGLAGTGVSLKSTNIPNAYLRHQGGRFKLSNFEDSALFKNDATFKVKPGLSNPALISLESHNFPNNYFRHRNNEFWMDGFQDTSTYRAETTLRASHQSFESYNFTGSYIRVSNGLANLTTVNNVLDYQEATFKVVPGLAGTGISFKASNAPNSYLRHQGGRLKLSAFESGSLYQDDATWITKTGLADGSLVSFESKNYPNNYLRHRNGQFWMDGFQDNNLFRADATFRSTLIPNR
jgi:GH43 family beta-xylosidase